MSVIDADLVRAINSGRCFALVGSGPSCELGVPSWERLAETVIERLNPAQAEQIIKECRKLLASGDYPKIFSLAARSMGLEELLAVVSGSLVGSGQRGPVYKYIASWPFPCYLTTNFDDHLSQHLQDIRLSFSVRRNSQDDMRVLRADSKNLIFKIHGETTVPQDIVLTSEQYSDFQNSQARAYWRDKILSVLNMVSLVVIGYSASDPDFQAQMARAKSIASPDHPVFMFAADFHAGQITQFYQQFNIRVIPYRNEDGAHRELQRLLKRYDPFIAKRGTAALGLEPVDESVATLASAMYVFTQLRLVDTTDACIEKSYASLILQSLAQMPNKYNIRIGAVRESLAAKTFAASAVDLTAMHKALEFLYSVGYISFSADHLMINLEPKGQEALATIKAERDLIREKFEEACFLFLRGEYSNLSDDVLKSVIGALQTGLVRAYEKRGMEIARSVFSNDVVDVSDATDVLETINRASSILPDSDQLLAFADLMIEVMLRPGEETREYLAALSQGYFAYHALGLEPKCSQERLVMAKGKAWILDSSILLPILALGCLNHVYARDLLKRMQELGLSCYTTERLFEEVREHAWWAITNFAHVPPYHPDFLQAAMAGPGFKQNLFLGGFMKWSLTQGAPSFRKYVSECLGPEYEKDLEGSIRSKVQELGIEIIDFSQWPGISEEAWSERDNTAKEIQRLRQEFGTFRSDTQCIAEAEVVLLGKARDAIFLSQSTVLNRLQGDKLRMTWKPEAMYRFLSLFSSAPTGTDLLYECMIQDLYYAGFDVVDEAAIAQYVAPMIRQARMELDHERARYERALGGQRFAELKDNFEHVPDEEKPFYSMQFAFYAAAEESRKREVAEAIAREAQKTKRLTEKERQELERFKASNAERKRKAEQRRRRSESRPKRKKKKDKKKKGR